MTNTLTHTLTRYDDNDNETRVEAEIRYVAYRGYAATLEEPGEEPSIEIDSVTNTDTGEEIELSDDELSECEQAAMDDAVCAVSGPDDYDD